MGLGNLHTLAWAFCGGGPGFDSCSLWLSFPSLMFWTNWNEQHPSIMRAALSGANALTLIEKDIRTPNGLAIDHRAEKLYFSDATLDKIERCEYDGSHRYVSLRGGQDRWQKGPGVGGRPVSREGDCPGPEQQRGRLRGGDGWEDHKEAHPGPDIAT